ncbi:MAG: SDR family oxidoreductase, partial [Clostridia bacterium]|nr:SDR family oxidoreductase [Clostridia bacterium]
MKGVIISGGSHGIGAAAAELFADAGWRVLIGYEKAEREAKELADRYKNVIPFQVDVTDESSVSRFVSKGVYEFGTVDALVTSAGVSLDKLFTETREEDWRRVMDVNAGG